MPFGIGGSEIVLIALLFLVIFGPNKIPQMARDIGKFVNQARGSIDEFKQEFNVLGDDEDEKKKKNQRPRNPRQQNNRHATSDTKARQNGSSSRKAASENSNEENASENGREPEHDRNLD